MKSIGSPDHIVVEPDIHGGRLDKFKFPHRFEPGCFLIVTSGSANISINLSSYEVGSNCVVTVLPRSIIKLNDWSDDFRCKLVAFSTEFVKDLTLIRNIITHQDNIGNHPVLSLTEEEQPLVEDYFRLLWKIYRKDGASELETGAAGNMLLSLFYCICSFYEKRKSGEGNISPVRREELTRNFLTLVMRHCETHREVKFYADRLCVTPQYLNSVIKFTKGEPASSIIKRVTILVIESQLKFSTRSIQEIAGDLNFPNPSFFTKFFKRETGMTPRQYRDS